MNSNFEHLVNTPALERDGMSEALRRVDWELNERNARHAVSGAEDWRETLERRCICALNHDYWFDDRSMHSLSDARAKARSDVRAQKRNLTAIRALRKELGL